MADLNSIPGEIGWLRQKFRQNWRPFLLIHLVVTIVVVALLAPALSALLSLAVTLSGDAALSDQGILFFFLSPAGFVSLSLLAALGSVIVVLEYAALLTAAGLTEAGRPRRLQSVFVFLGRRGPRLFGLALLILARVLLNLLPFLLLAALVYARLLTEYDINYYLAEQPPEWRMALQLGALIALGAGLNLLRLFVDWVLALPLLLFNDLGPAACLRESRAAARGQRLRTAGWLLGWLLFSALLVAAATLLIDSFGDLLIPRAATSIGTLLLFLGVVSLLGAGLSLAVSFVNTALLSLVILRLFLRSGLWRGVGDLSGADAAPPSRSLPRLPAWSLLAALGLSLLATWVLLERLATVDQSVVMAHRGASAAAPENTLAAVQGAIDSGADWVEIDVQETADGQIVVIHDSDLKKVGGVGLRVGQSPAAELREVDIGSWFAPEFGDERVPTLAEVLALCRDRIGVNIELKYYGHERRLEPSVAEIVEAAGMAGQVVLMSLSLDGIKAMRAVRPEWPVGLLSSVALGNLAALDVDFLALNGRAATRSLIRHAHAQGKQVFVWTINDAVGMHSMFGRGVDGIITDEPALAVSVLQQRAELEPSQRLLMQLADLFDNPGLYREQ